MVQLNAVIRFLCGLATMQMLWNVPVSHAEDDYLSLLEAEAAEMGAGVGSADWSVKGMTQKKKAVNMKVDKAIEQGLTFEAFEETLSAGYSGSNFLYMKLSEKERKGVYRFYQSDNRISSVREEIVRRLSSS